LNKPVENQLPNEENSYMTIKAFANKTGRTPQAVYKQIRKNETFKEKYTAVIKDKLMIHVSALDLYDVDPDPAETQKENPAADSELIALLKEQLQEKDKQIENLTKSLINAQTLQMAAERRYIALLEQKDTAAEEKPLNVSESVTDDSDGAAVDNEQENNSQDSQDKPEPEEKPIVKRGIWSKLFSKIKK